MAKPVLARHDVRVEHLEWRLVWHDSPALPRKRQASPDARGFTCLAAGLRPAQSVGPSQQARYAVHAVHAADAFRRDIDVNPRCGDEERLMALASKHTPLAVKITKRVLGDADHGNSFF